jgi:pimeloyl-ACP methyl ester carboxylesterase
LEEWARLPLFALDGDAARRRFIERRHRNIPAELARSLRGMGTGQQPNLWPALASLPVPTLAVAGGRDAKYADLVFEVAALAPTATPLVVPAGHAVHAEQPALFAALLRSFLSDPIPDTHLAL